MGSTDSIPQNSSLRLNRDNWQEQEAQDWEWDREGDYKRLKNNMTGEELDQYFVHLGSRESYNQYMEMCHFRNQENHLVGTKNINQENVKELCFNAFNLMVYIEHMYLRLSDIKDIQFPQNIYVLKRALEGLKILYEKVGYFYVTQNLICINQQGIVKVWLNPNLSLIEPQQTTGKYTFYSFKHKFDSQKQDEMIWNTIQMIESASNNHTIPNGFTLSSFLSRQNRRNLNFKETLGYLDQYIAETMIKVPDYFQTAIKVIRERKGIFDSQMDITINKPKTVDLQAAIMRGKFKESEVERVHGFPNQTMRSYISESNNTFADKLRHFGKGNSNSINLQSNISGFKQSPGKESAVESAIFNLHQHHTQRIISNQISQVSTPPVSQSHAILSSIHNGLARASIQNSQITSNEKSIYAANNPNQLTYFSQYLNKETKNQNNGQSQRRQAQGTTSLMTSRIGPTKLSSLQKPTISFTYSVNPSIQPSLNHSGQVSVNTSPHQSRIYNQQNQNQAPNFNFLPISPPTIDSTQKICYDYNSNHGNFSNPALEFSKGSNKGKKYFTRIDSFKAPTEQNSQIDSIIQNNNSFQRLEQSSRFKRMQNSQYNQINHSILSQSQNRGSQSFYDSSHNTVVPAPGVKPRSAIPQISLEEMKTFLVQNRLNLDPEIMNDLIRFEQRRRKI